MVLTSPFFTFNNAYIVDSIFKGEKSTFLGQNSLLFLMESFILKNFASRLCAYSVSNNCVHSGKIFSEHERTYVRLLGTPEY